MVIIRNADLNFYDYIIEIWQFLPNVLNFKKEEGPFASMLSLMVHHSKSACLVKILYCHDMFVAKVTVTANTVEPFVNKLGMVMFIMSWNVYCLSWSGSFHWNMTVSTISSELQSLLRPHLVLLYIIHSLCVLWKYWIAVFKVRVTVEVQNFTECLSSCSFNFLYHWSFLQPD